MKSEECKSLHLKIQEIEKTLQQRIEILYKEKSETEKKYFLKVEEANKIHTQLKDLEVNFNVKLESVHTQVSNERIMEIEKKYNYQIDQLY
jgi:predicted ATPase